jgi:hypothetical protein
MRKRTWTDEQLLEAVKTSFTLAKVIGKLGLQIRPGNYPTVKKRIGDLGLDISHFTGQAHGTTHIKRATKEVLTKGSGYKSYHLGPRLVKEGLLENRCNICGLYPEWEGKSLRLTLDHINGDREDNRLSNLRLLCPNCHSQTDTFCRKNK